jgi:hypothetical protein
MPTRCRPRLSGGRCPMPTASCPNGRSADGGGNPCRHCLQMIPEGAGMLVLAHRPFPAPQPYAEQSGRSFCVPIPCEAPGVARQCPRCWPRPTISSGAMGRMTASSMAPEAVVPTPRIAGGGRNAAGRSARGLCPCAVGPQQLLSMPDRPLGSAVELSGWSPQAFSLGLAREGRARPRLMGRCPNPRDICSQVKGLWLRLAGWRRPRP